MTSGWVVNPLLEYYERRDDNAAYQFYRNTERSHTTALIRGVIWERQVHKFFKSLEVDADYPLSLVSLEDDEKSASWTFLMTTVSQNVNDQTFGTSLREHVQANTTCCLLPTNPSFPSVNSVYFSRGQPFTCLPAMVASKHPIRVSGLERIQRGLPIKSPHSDPVRITPGILFSSCQSPQLLISGISKGRMGIGVAGRNSLNRGADIG